MRISIVIPVYNAAKTIRALVEKLLKEFTPGEIEIILVNDGSADESSAVCGHLQKCYPAHVKFINLSRNFGEHNAVMAGLKNATGGSAVIMDDDFQNPPSEAKRLVGHLGKDFDVVYGVYEKKHHGRLRNLGSWLNGIMANILLKKPKDLYLSSFKAMNRFVIDQITQYTHPYPYIDGLIFRVTHRIGKVVVQHSPRIEGQSNYTMTKLIRLWLNMFTNFSILPLRVTTLIGCTTVFFGGFIASLAIFWAFTDPEAPKGWPTLVCAMVIFSGVQLMALGVIGEYLGRLFLTQNGTPQYIIREIADEIELPPPPSRNPDENKK